MWPLEEESRDEPREWPRERLIYRGLLIANIGVGDGEPVECPPVIARVERAGLVEEARFEGLASFILCLSR